MKVDVSLLQPASSGKGSFYEEVDSTNGLCTFIKESENYSDNYSGVCHFEANGVATRSWVNLSSSDKEYVTLGNQRSTEHPAGIPIIVQILKVAKTADKEDLKKYGKKVGDVVLRFILA